MKKNKIDLKKNVRMKLPAVDSSKCNSCFTCIAVCTQNAILEPVNTTCAKCIKYCISMEVPCSPEHVIFSYELCNGCGICLLSCPQGAIYWYSRKPTEHIKAGESI